MADISITPSNVITALSGSKKGTAGEAISAGQLLYLKSSDNKLYKAQNDGTAEEATVVGMALCSAAAGQPLLYQASGEIAVGGAFAAAGVWFYLSATAGVMVPVADLTTNDYVSIIGYSTSTVSMVLDITNTGETSP